ncbi:hypothetical protein VTP01DRAFT_3875 [Rhizomucor pusillus]|uniref:uncharacterized protein n=1 Tax=Rhizomucor pusillus TaxID=4840 RepID=UPI003743FB44
MYLPELLRNLEKTRQTVLRQMVVWVMVGPITTVHTQNAPTQADRALDFEFSRELPLTSTRVFIIGSGVSGPCRAPNAKLFTMHTGAFTHFMPETCNAERFLVFTGGLVFSNFSYYK